MIDRDLSQISVKELVPFLEIPGTELKASYQSDVVQMDHSFSFLKYGFLKSVTYIKGDKTSSC